VTPQEALEAIVAERRRYPGGVPGSGRPTGSPLESNLIRVAIVAQYAGRLADEALHPGRFSERDLWAALGAVCMAALERL